jgi:hypothetical protein
VRGVQIAGRTASTGVVRSTLSFLAPHVVRAMTQISGPGGDSYGRRDPREERPVDIHDIRRRLPTPSLDVHGFAVIWDAPFSDGAERLQETGAAYSKRMADLTARALGAARAVPFDMTVRITQAAHRNRLHAREPVAAVHCDYTARSAARLVDRLLGRSTTRSRYAVINSWQPLAGPV